MDTDTAQGSEQSEVATGKTRNTVMIEAVLFDCWGTLLQAPSLMKRGASVEIFHRSLSRDFVEIDFEAFSEAYDEEASRQYQAAELDYHELEYAQRIDSALQEIGF